MTRLTALFAILLLASPATAAPRDELLRAAPADSALLIVVQNARDHIQKLDQSPFAKWFPQSQLGKSLFGGVDLKQAKAGLEPIFTALGIKPEELIGDVLGDAVAFAYTPAADGAATGERAVFLIRPRKPETLAKLVSKLNELQTASGEVKSVQSRMHRGEEYFERQKPNGPSDFYCFRGGVFAFSGTEPDIRAVIERDKDDAKSSLPAKLAKLGVSDSLAVALINPRHFDKELAAKVASAKPAEKAVLERFQEAWLALDSAAVNVALGSDFEIGVSVQFQAGKLPAFAKGLLTGPRENAAVWASIPNDALVAVAGKFNLADILKPLGLEAPVSQALGPVFGKDKLPQVLAALGPQWAMWAEPPAKDGFLPVAVAAVQIDGKLPAKVLERGIGYVFNSIRVSYNSSHADQIEIVDGDDGVTSLVNEKGFPPGFQPSYVFKNGWLVFSTSPHAVRRFQEPKPAPSNEAMLLRVSGTAIRSYLQANRGLLAKFLASHGHGDEKELAQQFDQFTAVLELVDRVELITRGDDTGLRLVARVRLAKPLKP